MAKQLSSDLLFFEDFTAETVERLRHSSIISILINTEYQREDIPRSELCNLLGIPSRTIQRSFSRARHGCTSIIAVKAIHHFAAGSTMECLHGVLHHFSMAKDLGFQDARSSTRCHQVCAPAQRIGFINVKIRRTLKRLVSLHAIRRSHQ